MKLGFVCTNYDNAGYTEAALRTLHAQPGSHEIHVVIVDNGSSGADLARLREVGAAFPRVEVVSGHGNVGYFPGLNIGIARLRSMVPDIEHVVIGNNDLEFPEGFVESVSRHRDVFGEWAVVAPDLVTPAHERVLVHPRRPITRARRAVWALYYGSFALAGPIAWGARLTRRFTARPERVHGDVFSREPGPVIMGYGACYILGPLFFGHFDRLYAPTFLMHEEFFLSAQLGAVGQQVYYDPRFVVRHRDHATFERLPKRRAWEISRDSYRTYREHLAMPRAQQVELITRSTARAAGA